MGINTGISQKFFNQIGNGSDFSLNTGNYTSNLVAVAGEQLKAVFDISIGWDSSSDIVNFWSVSEPTIGTGRIQRQFGSFLADGFAVGQSFDYFDDYSTVPVLVFSGTITAISASGNRLDFAVDSGVLVAGSATDSGIKALAASWPLTALEWGFGFPGTSESYSNVSKVSGSPMMYTAGGIGLGMARSTAAVPLIQSGIVSDWVTGAATVAYVSETLYEQSFRVEQEFIMAPFTNTAVALSLARVPPVAYSENMRYSYVGKFKKSVTAAAYYPVSIDDIPGSTLWYDTSFVASDYKAVSISYVDTDTADPQPSLIVSEKTTVTITIEKTSAPFAAGQRAGVMVTYIPRSLGEFQGTETTVQENFLYDSLFHDEGTGATVGTGIIKLLDSSIGGGGELILFVDIEYTLTEAQKAEGGAYMLAVIVGDTAMAANESDRMNLIVDVRRYTDVNIIPLLCQYADPITFFGHGSNFVSGTETIETWNEDGIVARIPFALDLSRAAFLSSFAVKLVAYKVADGSYFELDNYIFNTAGAIVSGGVQQINISQQRPYSLPDGDAFRCAKIETGALVVDLQEYLCTIGQKISWQEWILLPGADTVFFDAGEPNSGLNEKASRYSLQNGYEIRMIAEASVRGNNNLGTTTAGVSEGVSDTITVNDYDTGAWYCEIKTRNPDTLADIGGNILAGLPTVFRAEFSKAAPFSDIAETAWIVLRIEDFNDTGSGISEYSSLRPNIDGRLYSIDGSGFLALSIDAGKLIAECLINPSGFSEGQKFNLSARGEAASVFVPKSFNQSFNISFF
jgi:hypothetical protein